MRASQEPLVAARNRRAALLWPLLLLAVVLPTVLAAAGGKPCSSRSGVPAPPSALVYTGAESVRGGDAGTGADAEPAEEQAARSRDAARPCRRPSRPVHACDEPHGEGRAPKARPRPASGRPASGARMLIVLRVSRT